MNIRSDSITSEKHAYGMLFGLLAGFVFSFTVWGVDAIQLTLAHGMFPWLKFVAGGIPVMLVGAFAGWLGYRQNSLLVSFLLWLSAGLVFSWISAHLPFNMLSGLIRTLNPEVGALISYPFVIGATARAFIIFVAVTGLTTIAGMFHINLVESAATGAAPLTRILPVALWIGMFYLAGVAPDNNVYQELREPVAAIQDLMQFASETEGTVIDPQVIRETHYGAIRGIIDLVDQPHQLILTDFDESLAATHVTVKFEDNWASCYLVHSIPSNCELVTYDELVADAKK